MSVPPPARRCHDGAVTAVGVLGPVLLAGPRGEVRLGSARQRRLLAALAAHPGAAVGTAALAELVFDDPPADPAGAVQTNVARLRRLLPPGVAIATTPEGYRLDADRAAVDATAFADRVAAAPADPELRRQRLEAALRLWRGRPFAELDHPSLAPEVARLTALRTAATEQHAAALLDTGRVGEAVAAAEAIVAAEPLREAAVGLLVRALVAAGRQGDALAALARLRERLADELGLDPAPELRALEQRVLRQELPAPRGAAAPRPRAPRVPVSSFVGRDADLARAVALLDGGCRVVTLCGPGGVGKTRLATHVAAAVAERYDDGALVVGFGDGGPADVEPVLAAALGLADDGRTGASTLADRVVDVLAVRRQLLVLDNCEHVADDVARLVEAVAGGTGGVDLLLTSREPLRVDGEHLLAVEPLDDAAARRLLTDRIRAGAPADPPGPDEDVLVAELCRRLDRLPLALELAAARARPLGLPGLLRAVERPLEALRDGRRTAAGRHRSLRDVVAWSHGLLSPAQRELFERMAVFAGPVGADAVAAVCGSADALPDLVERSLVVRGPGEPARFGMLETLRAYGRAQLTASGAGPALRARHARWAVALAVELSAARLGPGEAAAVPRFDDHLADLRRAHAWLCEHGPVEDLLRLGVLFGGFAYLRGRIDLVRLVDETVTAVGDRAHPLAARLLGQLATTHWQRGELDAAEACSRRALDVAAACGDPAAGRDGAEALANVHLFRGDLAGAAGWAHRGLRLADEAGDPEVRLFCRLDLVLSSAYAGDDPAAAAHEAAIAALLPELDSPTARAFLAYARGERRAERGDPAAAGFLREAVRLAEEVDSRFVSGIARHTLLTCAARGGGDDPAAVLASLRPLIDHWHAYGAWTHLWIAVRAVVEVLARLGRHAEAAVLLGALRASPRATPAFGPDAARERAVEGAGRAALGEAFDALLAEGAARGDAGAVALARRITRADPVPVGGGRATRPGATC
jgi:predicted ATPase/DNA-binding SARP family transcriptional activator